CGAGMARKADPDRAGDRGCRGLSGDAGMTGPDGMTRRAVLAGAGGMTALLVLPARPGATPAEVEAAILEDFGSLPAPGEAIGIAVPALAESGNSVPLTVSIDSPMTDGDHIARIVLYAEANPHARLAEM